MKPLVKKHTNRMTTEEADQICRINIVFNLVAAFFLTLFSIISINGGDLLHSKFLLLFVWVALANVLVFLITGRMALFILTSCFGFLIFCVYIQITGGEENTGILWHYLYPLMVFYLAGIQMGGICAGLLILFEIILMVFSDLFPFQTVYSPVFKSRFLATMVMMSIFGAMLEYSRWTAQQKLIKIAGDFKRASQTDELTGLANRRALRARMEDEAARSIRGNEDFVIIIGDVDHFKSINDRYGHTAGDTALKHLAGIFNKLLRKYDVAARWGGEEFLFLLPDTDLVEGKDVAERIRSEVAHTAFRPVEGKEEHLTISLGVGNWKSHPNIDDLMRVTDDRLYRAKEMGRNRIVWED